MHLIQNSFSSIEQMTGEYLSKKQTVNVNNGKEQKFDEILARKQEELKFSKHANERLNSRNIDLSAELKERLEHGTRIAREKGINESLVMVDDLAFIVNVKNNIVVTAVNDVRDAAFTNIDGAVIS